MLLKVINGFERKPWQPTTKRVRPCIILVMFDSDILLSQSRNFSLHSGCQRSLLPHIFTSFCIASAKCRKISFVLHRQKFSIQFHCYLLLFRSKLIAFVLLRSSRVTEAWIYTLSILIIHYVNVRKSLPGCK